MTPTKNPPGDAVMSPCSTSPVSSCRDNYPLASYGAGGAFLLERFNLIEAQAAHDKALRLAQTRKQAETLIKLRAARHALLKAELRNA